jgi:hypothetical protein
MSLTGALYPEAHDDNLNVLLDADFHTGLLSVCFSRPLTQRMISCSIAPDDVDKRRRDTWLDHNAFREHVPSMAIVGVGVLCGGRHRFYEAVKRNNPVPGLKGKALENLGTLVSLADRHTNEIYCPVADVCNRLMYIEPPRSYKKVIPSADARRIRDLIEEINKRLLTVSLDQLGTVGGLVLVAGTRAKTTAMLKLLEDGEQTPPRVRVQVVCTDAVTAKLILELAGPRDD